MGRVLMSDDWLRGYWEGSYPPSVFGGGAPMAAAGDEPEPEEEPEPEQPQEPESEPEPDPPPAPASGG